MCIEINLKRDLKIETGEMITGLENLAKMEYPGRIIIIGRDRENENDVIVYGITGRSPSSQARILKYELSDDKLSIKVKPTDEEKIKEGNIALLLYDAIICSLKKKGIIVSNGAQTDLIYNKFLEGGYKSPLGYLDDALRESYLIRDVDITSYEPDPNSTPRISGIAIGSNAVLCIISKSKQNSSSEKSYFQFALQPGKGKLIATYTGNNVDPLPPFEGVPLDVVLEGNIEQITNNVYQALGEFKVSVACVLSGQKEPYIINKNLNKGN